MHRDINPSKLLASNLKEGSELKKVIEGNDSYKEQETYFKKNF